MRLKLVTAATAQPVSTAEAKSHSRITASNEDADILRMIKTATDYTERLLGRALVARTYDAFLNNFPYQEVGFAGDYGKICLPYPPLISISFVKYYDTNGTLQTWSSSEYVVDNNDDLKKGELYPAYNYWWPSTRLFPNAVNIRYIAGYADSGASPLDLADNVPEGIKHAIKMLVAHLFENREATMVSAGMAGSLSVLTVPKGYDSLVAQYKIQEF